MRALEYLLNFRTNKAVLGSTNQDIKNLRENVTGIGSSFQKVHSELTKFANSQKWMNITGLTQNVAQGVFGVAKSLKTVFSASLNFIDNLATEGDKVAKSARLVGMSVKDYQAFAFAAERSGMALETFDSGMKKFSANLGKARSGDKTAGSMFKALLPGKLSDYKSEREILLAMSDSYTKLSASQKNFVSQQMFGLRATQFGELLGGGASGVDSLLKKYESLGGGFDDETTKKAETFKDLMTDIKVTMESFKILVGTELLPVFNELFESISKYFVENRGELRKIFSDFGKQFVGGLKQMIPLLPSVISGMATIFSYVGKIVDYIGPVKTLIGVGILGSLGSIIGIVTSLAGLIGGPTLVAITGVAVLFGEVYSIITQIRDNWDMLTGAIHDMWADFKKSWSDYWMDAFSGLEDGLENSIAKGIINGARKAVKSIPLFGNMIFSDVKFDEPTGNIIGDDDIKEMERFKNRTITNKFSVDFKNMPRSVKVTAPKSGDFDYSYGYLLDGGV